MKTRNPFTSVRRACLALVAAAALTVGAASALAGTTGSGFYIRGGGFGNDIGMSQYGAAGFAQHGYKYAAILKHYYAQTTLGKVSPTRTVTVLLADGGATFSGATTIAGSKTKLKSASHYGVLLDGSKVKLISGGRTIGKFKAPLTVSGPGPLDLIGQGHYRGRFVFRSDGAGTIQTVNALGLDNYVRGVVAAEMPAAWPQQALDAQAVAARTYALTSGDVARTFMLYDDTRSQMYEGVSAETTATNNAVKTTSGQVVDYNDAPVTTYFGASSGGHTESVAFAWGVSPEAWLVGVSDPYDDSFDNPYYRWKVNLAVASAGGKLDRYVKGSLKGIAVSAGSAKIVGSGGSTVVDGAELEAAFGTISPNMAFTTITDKSAIVTVSASSSSSGSGSGSGSGTGSPNGGTGLAVTAKKAKTKKVPEVQGTIFPVKKGLLVTAQRDVNGAWKKISAEKLPATGKFAIRVSVAGTYRVVYRTIDGPKITVK